MPLYSTTELEAVNEMLAQIGESKVTTIEDETIEDAQMALDTLRQVSREVQTIGWHFNTDYDYPISVNVDLKLPIPVTAAHVDPMDTESKDLVHRGDFLWDRENLTYLFAAGTTVKCKVVWFLDFEDLPQACRVYIMIRAARRFAQRVMGDEATVQYTAQDEQMARGEFIRDELRRADYNLLTSNYSTSRIFIGRGITWRG